MRWGGRLGALPGWNAMSPCGSTLRGDAGAASVLVSGVCTLGGRFTCGGAALVNISTSFLRATVCFSPNVVSWIVGVGLRRSCFSSASACDAAFFEDSLVKVSVARGKYAVSETLYFAVFGDVGC